MTTRNLLAEAITSVVRRKFSSGSAFVRVPEIATPFPLQAVLDDLLELPSLRIAVFIDGEKIKRTDRLTDEVDEANGWRNEPDRDEDLLIIGHLERDRAQSLKSIPKIEDAEVRRELTDLTVREASAKGASQRAQSLLKAVGDLRSALGAHADYCEGFLAGIDQDVYLVGCASLWKVGLLPESGNTDVDLRRLRENQTTITQLKTSDATTIQRLTANLAHAHGPAYEAVRRFARSGRWSELQTLNYEVIRDALKVAKGSDTPGGKSSGQDTSGGGFLGAIRASNTDEDAILEQLQALDEEDAADTVTFGEFESQWDRVAQSGVALLMSDPAMEFPYATAAGSVERIDADEPDPIPGKGVVTWDSLESLVEDLKVLQEGLPFSGPPPSEHLEQILGLRRRLAPYVFDIPREGVRLLMAAKSLRVAASDLVSAWVKLWRSLEEARTLLDDVSELSGLASRLALVDTRLVVQGGDITAILLPLHPAVLEPRVRAAHMFLDNADLSEEFFALVQAELDPSVPMIQVPGEDAIVSIPYADQFRWLPAFRRRSTRHHSPDVVRSLQDIIDRFVNVHPYASLSLRVAVVDPTAESAKQLLKWLANVDPSVRRRVALDVYLTTDSAEVGERLSEAREELVSAEISPSRFTFDIYAIGSLSDLPDKLRRSDRSPHLLCLFDPASVTSVQQSALQPSLGALVNEWQFGISRTKEATPYIRPRSGSSDLVGLFEVQSKLLGAENPFSTQRTPLLTRDMELLLEELGAETSWIVVSQGASALVAPPTIGSLQLLGRTTSGSHISYVYSESPIFVLEPVLAYLQQHALFSADSSKMVDFTLGTIRMALPEGLLGFYKRQGRLSDESVLGRLGLAAVVAYLQDSEAESEQLVVSLDTEGARRWLGLRDGGERRADLLRIRLSGAAFEVEAIEVKARSSSEVWGPAFEEATAEALVQVEAMSHLLHQVLGPVADGDHLTASRREILKRQVFLEALHQWEGIRTTDRAEYRRRIDLLNHLFLDDTTPTVSKRVFLITPNATAPGEDGVSHRDIDGVQVTQLGLDWLRKSLSKHAGPGIEIDPSLLDLFAEELFTPAASSDSADFGSGSDEATDVAEVAKHPPRAVQDPLGVEPSEDDRTEDLGPLTSRLSATFSARGIPFVSILSDEAIIGPSVVQMAVRLKTGSRISQLESQADDIARDAGVASFRVSNSPGRPGHVLIDIPRSNRVIPDVASLTKPLGTDYPALALGAQLDFSPFWEPLDRFPHLLIAGKTGSGKSILVRSILWQLTRLYSADELDLVLIGPKPADYLDFEDAAHFKTPHDFHLSADGALDLLRDIVEVRYPQMNAAFTDYARRALKRGVRVSNLRELLADSRNSGERTSLRPFVVIIDEFVDLLETDPSARKDFEALIGKFSRLFRFIGGSMIAATQRPSAKSITGDIKANFKPLALRVERQVDSQVILGEGGAEHLVGMGDLLYKSDDGLVRLQGYSAIGTYI
jgi:hypothetical protein